MGKITFENIDNFVRLENGVSVFMFMYVFSEKEPVGYIYKYVDNKKNTTYKFKSSVNWWLSRPENTISNIKHHARIHVCRIERNEPLKDYMTFEPTYSKGVVEKVLLDGKHVGNIIKGNMNTVTGLKKGYYYKSVEYDFTGDLCEKIDNVRYFCEIYMKSWNKKYKK